MSTTQNPANILSFKKIQQSTLDRKIITCRCRVNMILLSCFFYFHIVIISGKINIDENVTIRFTSLEPK